MGGAGLGGSQQVPHRSEGPTGIPAKPFQPNETREKELAKEIREMLKNGVTPDPNWKDWLAMKLGFLIADYKTTDLTKADDLTWLVENMRRKNPPQEAAKDVAAYLEKKYSGS